jgi:hypothetical protein
MLASKANLPSLGGHTLTQINPAAGTLVLVALTFALWFSIYVGADCCGAKCRRLALFRHERSSGRCPLPGREAILRADVWK